MIGQNALPKSTMPVRLGTTQHVSTVAAGTTKTTEMVKLRNLKLPEFDKKCHISEPKALSFGQNIGITLV